MCGCRLCGGKDEPEKLIVCEDCDFFFHTRCVDPPLEEIPEDDWYCLRSDCEKKHKSSEENIPVSMVAHVVGTLKVDSEEILKTDKDQLEEIEIADFSAKVKKDAEDDKMSTEGDKEDEVKDIKDEVKDKKDEVKDNKDEVSDKKDEVKDSKDEKNDKKNEVSDKKDAVSDKKDAVKDKDSAGVSDNDVEMSAVPNDDDDRKAKDKNDK